MSLHNRVVTEVFGAKTRFKDSSTDAFQHTDRWRKGRRNKTPEGWFIGKNKRYPRGWSLASAAGALRQAYDREGKESETAIAIATAMRKEYGVCPQVLHDAGECKKTSQKAKLFGGPGHGPGGVREYTTSCKGKHCKVKKTAPDNTFATAPWPFTHKPGKPKWDDEWSAYGGKIKSAKKKRFKKKVKKTISSLKKKKSPPKGGKPFKAPIEWMERRALSFLG
jgi:hypothetical protein